MNRVLERTPVLLSTLTSAGLSLGSVTSVTSLRRVCSMDRTISLKAEGGVINASPGARFAPHRQGHRELERVKAGYSNRLDRSDGLPGSTQGNLPDPFKGRSRLSGARRTGDHPLSHIPAYSRLRRANKING
jgi:hypothetical protein